ncbi:MAG TPA: DUF1961 family protein [Glaciihabitans sp.]|nr:DUF1961 family protein [Glaciihabitans sp.]
MTEYHRALSTVAELDDWILEGPALLEQGEHGVVLSSVEDTTPSDGNFTLWCPEEFGDDVLIEWEFRPIGEPGLAMIFFAATGHSGDLFGAGQAPRDGSYPQYHSGDINALHVSYFRHKWAEERAFRTCNLRKSAGFHLVARGADPLPPAEDATDFYRMSLRKVGPTIDFAINQLPLLHWVDTGEVRGPALAGGRVGFRQMAPLVAEYRNFTVSH